VHRRRLRPALEKLACDLADQVKVVNVNVDETPRLQARFGVEAVPTLMLLRGTRILAYHAGAPPEPSLRAWLAQALGESETMQAGEPSQAANSGLSGLAEDAMWPELLRSTVGTSASASELRARGSRGRAMKSDSEIREDVIRELQWDPQVQTLRLSAWRSRTGR
jgi:thioredoxin-like negative regulator of GroEL